MAGLTVGMDQLLADVQVLSLGAGQSLQTTSGAATTVGTGVVQMTPNSVNTTTVLRNLVWDGLYFSVHPGTLAAGAAEPDLWMFVKVDNEDYSSWFYVDLSVSGCMFPRRQNTVGGKVNVLGQSLLQAALRNNPSDKKNMPLKYTGLKVSDEIEIWFYSAAGFAASAFTEPPTVQLYGDVLDQTALSFVQQRLGWVPDLSMQSIRRALAGKAAYTNKAAAGGFLTLAGWKSGPNGPHQGGVAIRRMVKAALNAQAIGASPYGLTKFASVGGANTNLASTNMDMGFEYTKTQNAVKLTEFGRRPGANAGYTGLYFGGSTFSPADTSLGMVSTQGNPRVQYGAVQPVRPESNLYFNVPSWGAQSPGEAQPEVVADETAAIAVAAQNGGIVAANTDKTALGGIQVVVGQAA